jgi:hypothetical protein
MADVSLRAYLAALDAHELAALLKRRPDLADCQALIAVIGKA